MKCEIKARLQWVTLYLKTEDAGLVCRKCGVSRPTLRQWVRRYQQDGEAGFESKPRPTIKPKEKKVSEQIPIQRVQTDRGTEFFAYVFQQRLMNYAIKSRPIKPRSPHLNGKVERSQKTDWDEVYSTVDFSDPDLNEKLRQWQDYYNHERPHGSLVSVFSFQKTTPSQEKILKE